MGSEYENVSGQPDRGHHPIVSLLANMMNYLNVSFYEGLFTHNHERARAKLNELYDLTSSASSIAPSINNIIEFYNNVKSLRQVTDTDDYDYHNYMRQLYQYIQKCQLIKPNENTINS